MGHCPFSATFFLLAAGIVSKLFDPANFFVVTITASTTQDLNPPSEIGKPSNKAYTQPVGFVALKGVDTTPRHFLYYEHYLGLATSGWRKPLGRA
jgi:hypothetical protein